MRFVCVVVAVAAGCEAGPYQSVSGDGGVPDVDAGAITIDLVVDTNRDGELSVEDDEGQESWDAAHGAIFLANRDDDDPPAERDRTTPPRDSEDEIINGDADLLDLAPIEVTAWPGAPGDTSATLTIDVRSRSHVRVFRLRDGAWSPVTFPLEIGSASIQTGLTLAIEGLDLLQDGDWDGRVSLGLVVRDGTGATIREETAVLRQAPVLLSWNSQPTSRVFVSDVGGQDNQTLIDAIQEAADDVQIECRVIDAALYLEAGTVDQWTQDFFEVGAQYMPSAEGWQRMGVGIRLKPPMASGLFVEFELYGPDFAFIEPFGDLRAYDPYSVGASLDYGGNLEVVPPHEGYPAGRILMGSQPSRFPHPIYFDFLQAQYAQSPVLEADTTWLVVGHIDEISGFVQAPGTTRGWKMLLGAPREAWEMLEDLVAADPANADVVMFEGQFWSDPFGRDGEPATITIGEVLDDADLAATNDEAQTHADDLHDLFVSEVGLTEDDIIYLPYLWEELGFPGGMLAYQPGSANLLTFNGVALVPKPFGPIIDGEDPFEVVVRERLETVDLDVRFVDNWNLYHRLEGEIHCGSNTDREMPTDVAWWEMNR